MNADRRATARVCIELMTECAILGDMSESAYEALRAAIGLMKQGEYWSLRNQSKHEGKNPSTDASIAVSRVALPALEAAARALEEDDFTTVVEQLTLALVDPRE